MQDLLPELFKKRPDRLPDSYWWRRATRLFTNIHAVTRRPIHRVSTTFGQDWAYARALLGLLFQRVRCGLDREIRKGETRV